MRASPPRVRVFGTSDIGNVRKENQDCFAIHEPQDPETVARKGVLVVLADGMGGLEGGRVASHLAVDTVRERYFSFRGDPRTSLEAAVKEANGAIYDKANEGGVSRQMGSTITALVVLEDRAVVAQVGDSRGWRYRHGNIQQLTRDHSLVRELLERGEIEPDSAQYAFHRNILTRGLGLRDEVAVDTYELLGVEAGDTYLVSSDGLHELVSPDDMVRILEAHGDDLEGATQEMVELAKQRGGPDNITLAGLRAEPEPSAAGVVVAAPERTEVPRRAALIFIAAVLGSFVLGVLLTLWAIRATPASSSGAAARVQELEEIIELFEDERIPAQLKLEQVGRLRAVLDELGVLETP